ncbi:transposase, partial [Thermodesulfovibrio thiophilus]|uniref:transposase n=1 Tax=Thermodesulfovibrio thiophilus TaxID=340095 RepID=UPI00184570BB
MGKIRKKYEAALKARIALEAVKGEKTIREISSEYGVHPNQIMKWKQQLLKELPSIFSEDRAKEERGKEDLEAELYR